MHKTNHLRLAAPAASAVVNGTVRAAPPRRQPNAAVRTREHLTVEEVEQVIVAARQRGGRYGHRDSVLILVAYTHGLRVSEIVALRWDQVDFQVGLLHVTRVKRGEPSTHPLRARELRALRQLRREQTPPSPWVFTTERRTPMSAAGVRKLITRVGQAAELPFGIHPHMLRHGCGFKLASDGQDTRAIQAYLGHRSIQHTTRYTALAPGRFKGFWAD